MKKHSILLAALIALFAGSCYAEFDLHPQPRYQHFRWCWHTFYHPACFMTLAECEADETAHDLESVTPCQRERYFTNER